MKEDSNRIIALVFDFFLLEVELLLILCSSVDKTTLLFREFVFRFFVQEESIIILKICRIEGYKMIVDELKV